MQEDKLLQEWRRAKEICQKIIEIAIRAHLQNMTIEDNGITKQSGKQFMNVYDTVYKLCITKEKEETRVLMVYKEYKDILKNGLMAMCQFELKEKGIYRLGAIKKIWDGYCDVQKRLIHMFAYLNRPFHIKEGKIEDLDKTGINIILTTLFTEITVVQYESLYFKELERIRKTQDFSQQQFLSNIVDIFYQIHLKIVKNSNNKKMRTIYSEFHSKYLKTAREYYQRMYKTLKDLSPSEYFTEVFNLYNFEVRLAQNCFIISGDSLISHEFSQEFIQKYRNILLTSQNGLKSIFKNGQNQILKIIVELNLKLSKNIDGFKEQFQQFVYEDTKNYIDEIKTELLLKKSTTISCNFIDKIIKKNKEFLNILQSSLSFVGDFASYYKSGVEKAFGAVKLNEPIEQTLAIYADFKLKNGGMSEEELEDQVKSIIGIFICAHNKDLFLLKYSQKLTKRILSLTQDSLKNHQILIANLKLNCGMKYTERLQTIITEYHISLQNEIHLKNILEEEKVMLGFTLKIFSEGAWPTPLPAIIEVPFQYYPKVIDQAYNCMKIFKDKFCNKKTLKISALESKMRWIYYFDKSVESKLQQCYFDTNCLQSAILYYIYRNRPQKVSLQFLEEYLSSTKINKNLISESLSKLAETNDNILIKTIHQNSNFYQFNSYMKVHRKGIISYDVGQSAEEEKLFQQHDLGKDREIVLDANIAKYMKSKKVVDFETLINQVTKMIKVFVPQSKDIKTAIDRLITKDILQRDEKDKAVVRYLD